MSNLTALTFSQQVEKRALEDNSSLIDAMVNICDLHQVPYEDVCRFQENGATVNLITPQLKAKLEVQCSEAGLLVGRRPNSNDLTEIL